ncbi:MAG: hypothetical protein J0I93_11290 [Legionella sp.]|nr:hypothetical protein [Legionella sp.]
MDSICRWLEAGNKEVMQWTNMTPTDARQRNLMDSGLRVPTINRRLLSLNTFEWGCEQNIKYNFPA